MAQTNYKVGDIIFFTTGSETVAGEGMFIGQLKNSPDNLVLVIGKQIVEVAAKHCTPTRGGFPAEGASWRRDYLKQHPDSLQSLSKVRLSSIHPCKSLCSRLARPKNGHVAQPMHTSSVMGQVLLSRRLPANVPHSLKQASACKYDPLVVTEAVTLVII